MPIRGIVRHEAVTIGNSATAMTITASNGNLPEAALIEVEDAAIRFRADGSDPTSTTGHNAEVGEIIELVSKDEVQKFRAIRRDGVDATLRITQGIEFFA